MRKWHISGYHILIPFNSMLIGVDISNEIWSFETSFYRSNRTSLQGIYRIRLRHCEDFLLKIVMNRIPSSTEI